ncbi:hypothetical protein BT69DRAFT_1285947 [Atractiella rhizophila]|nr:hypothetical protein BT69DRAFT_1285947 [Atractiella rhizophila]
MHIRHWVAYSNPSCDIKEPPLTPTRETEKHLSHLILVPGHAIYHGPLSESNRTALLDPSNWALESFQSRTSPHTFLSHISKGVELLAQDRNALLVFSGGQTREEFPNLSEGGSYWLIAKTLELHKLAWEMRHAEEGQEREERGLADLLERTTSEEYALDSLTNLLYSLCRFYEYTSHYPSKITIVGYSFKSSRFLSLHAHALRFPSSRIHYIGIDDDDLPPTSQQVNGESRTRDMFAADMYGCHGTLVEKKRRRNPWRRFSGYWESNPPLRDVLNWCPYGGDHVFRGYLPWDLDTH